MDYKEKLFDLLNEFDEKNVRDLRLDRYINKLKGTAKKLCIFGAGTFGIEIYQKLAEQNVKVDFFCDNNREKTGETIIDNVKCLSFEQLCEIKDDTLVLIAMGKYDEVIKQFKTCNIVNFSVAVENVVIYYAGKFSALTKEELHDVFDKLTCIFKDDISLKVLYRFFANIIEKSNNHNAILSYNDIYSENEYFNNDIVEIKDDVTFIDCGAYDGDTLKSFLDAGYGKNLGKYYCYEFDNDVYFNLLNNIKEIPENIRSKIFAFNLGVYSEEKTISYFSGKMSTTANVNSKGNKQAKLVALDNHLKSEVDFIKMDIEGSEPEALKGAQKLIKKYKPTLAICTYHTFEHLWEIPFYIKSLVPEYKMYLRHHSNTMFETACYAKI